MPLCPVLEAVRALLCLDECATDSARHHGSGERVLVLIVREGTAGLLHDVRIAIAMGAFDTPTSTHLEKHLFVAEKGDYYEISDDLPKFLTTA